MKGPLMVCYGTRPQVIKASALLPALRAGGDQVVAVDTGQHYDYQLNRLLYEQLGVPLPDHCLDVRSGDPDTQTATIMGRTAALLERYRPRAVIVLGDTNSTLGCGLAAAKRGIGLVHIEAGLRAADWHMPEDINRRLVDVISDLLCVPSRAAAANLRDEGIRGRVVRTGDLARDVLVRVLDLLTTPERGVPPGLDPEEPFVLTTLHRAELVRDPRRTRRVVEAVAATGFPVLFPAHPRTWEVLNRGAGLPDNVVGTGPLGYLDTINLVRSARTVVTDSGGLQREAYWLGTPCITVRAETEWRETVLSGANTLVPSTEPDRLTDTVLARASEPDVVRWNRDAYGSGDAAGRIVRAVREQWGGDGGRVAA